MRVKCTRCRDRGIIVKPEEPIINRAGFSLDNGGPENIRFNSVEIACPDCKGYMNPNELTKREKQVAHYLVRGDSNKIIARTLSLSYRTIEVHVNNILHKLEISSRRKVGDKLGLRKLHYEFEVGDTVEVLKRGKSLNSKIQLGYIGKLTEVRYTESFDMLQLDNIRNGWVTPENVRMIMRRGET